MGYKGFFVRSIEVHLAKDINKKGSLCQCNPQGKVNKEGKSISFSEEAMKPFIDNS